MVEELPYAIVISFILGILGFLIGMYKFYELQKQHNIELEQSQKQHNENLEQSQKHFNSNQNQSRNIEIVNQLEHFHAKFVEIADEFANSDTKYLSCFKLAKKYLLLLERLSYLKEKKLVDSNFIQFFENMFNAGRCYLVWLKFTDKANVSYERTYPNYNKIVKTISFQNDTVQLSAQFYHYSSRLRKNKDYSPVDDPDPPSTIVSQSETNAMNPNHTFNQK